MINKLNIKKNIKVFSVLFSSFYLVSCSTHVTNKSNLTKPPLNTSYSKVENIEDYKKKSNKPIIKYVPVPLPGQLKKVPNFDIKKEFKTKEEAVKYANQQAKVYPDSNDFFNSIMVYNYIPGSVYTIYTAPLHITDIALEKGEKLISQAAGDTIRWQIAKTYSGEGQSMRQHLLIKPNKPNLENTMIITTNKRIYNILLKSVDSDSYMVAVRWNYPSEEVTMYNGYSNDFSNGGINSNSESCPSIDIANVDSNYSWSVEQGDKPSWMPVSIFSTVNQTFIRLSKESMKENKALPILEVANDINNYASMVNWRFKCNYIIVDSVFKYARLKTGVESLNDQTVVQISKVN